MSFNDKMNNQPPKKIWKAGFYIRLSREDVENDKSIYNMRTCNKTESESITTQRAILTDFVNQYNDIELIDEYVDDGFTGTNFDRPGFQRMLNDIKNKKIDCVIVKDLSRFGRNYVEVGNYLEVVFPLLNVRFIAKIDNCDSYLRPESVSNIIVPVKNIMNESYCRDLSLKIKSAQEARKRNGLFVGTYAAYGYKKQLDNRNKLIIDEEAAEIVKRIFKDFVSGLSKTKIAKNLNEEGIPSPAVYKSLHGINKYVNGYSKTGWKDTIIARLLKDEIYIGTLVQGKRQKISYKIDKFRKVDEENYIRVPNAVEPIIDVETFNKAQLLLKRDTRVCFQGELNLFAGFIHCAECKHGMSIKKSKTWDKKSFIRYYVCSTYKNCGKSICSSHHINAQKVEDCVLEYIKSCINVATNFEQIVEFINKVKCTTTDTSNLEKILATKKIDLQKKEQFIDGLYPDYRAGIITQTEYQKYKDKATNEYNLILNDIDNLKTQIEEIKQGTCCDNEFIQHFKKYRNIDKLDRKMIVDLIDNIWIHNANYIEIDIKYKDQYAWALEFIQNNRALLETNNKVVNANG